MEEAAEGMIREVMITDTDSSSRPPPSPNPTSKPRLLEVPRMPRTPMPSVSLLRRRSRSLLEKKPANHAPTQTEDITTTWRCGTSNGSGPPASNPPATASNRRLRERSERATAIRDNPHVPYLAHVALYQIYVPSYILFCPWRVTREYPCMTAEVVFFPGHEFMPGVCEAKTRLTAP